MLNLVLILNTVVALWGGLIIFRQTRNYVIYLFEVMFLLFFVVRPFLVSPLDLLSFDLMRFAVDDRIVLTYAICGLIFILVFHLTVYRLYRRERLFSDRFFRICNFDSVSRGRLVLVLLMLTLLTYAVNTFKFHSPRYFLQSLDSFDAGMQLASGLWFVQVLSGILIFPIVAFLGKNLNAKPWKVVASLLVAMALFNVVAKPSTRTETIALLTAVAIYYFSTKKIGINPVSLGVVGACVIILLVLMDRVRQGDMETGVGSSDLLSLLVAAFQNVGPADNSMILIGYLKTHSWLYFRYLLPSLSPLSLVPSAVFPFKPRVDIEGALTYSIFGFDLDPATYHEGGTLTFTVPGAGYADLGFIGVIVAALIYGFIFSVFLRGWKCQSRSVRFITVYYLIFLIAGFRLSVEALMGTFYWVILATWAIHFASHFRFLGPLRVTSAVAPVPAARNG